VAAIAVAGVAVLAGLLDDAEWSEAGPGISRTASDMPSAGETSASEAPSAQPSAETSQAAAGEAGSGPGNPLPLGSRAEHGDWRVMVNLVELDATEAVLAANRFNAAPAAGNQYALVNITVAYLGAGSSEPFGEVGLEYITADGVGLAEAWASAPGALDQMEEIDAGGARSGNLVFEIPTATAAEGVLAVDLGFLTEARFYFAVT
jgi:hypothetical protein